jgi:hypothetical protein
MPVRVHLLAGADEGRHRLERLPIAVTREPRTTEWAP